MRVLIDPLDRFRAVVNRAFEAIAAADGGLVSVTELADAIGVGRRRLERSFQICERGSVLAALLAARLDRVERLLATSNEPISQIANECGFSSPSYLVATYKKRKGMTPGRFRTELQRAAHARRPALHAPSDITVART